MRLTIIDRKECQFPRSIYCGKNYIEWCERVYKCPVIIVRLSNNRNQSALLVLVKRKISEEFYECFSPYGYSGIVGNIENISKEEMEQIKDFFKANKICNIFIRHDPLQANQKILPNEDIEINRITYSRKLRKIYSFEEYLNSMPQKIRASCRNALRNKLIASISDKDNIESELDQFMYIYGERMKMIGANLFYAFNPIYLKEFMLSIKELGSLYIVRDSNTEEIVAGCLTIADEDKEIVHYHLSSATKYGLQKQANELLLSYTCYIEGNRGRKIIHLGGGHNSDESDGLSKFKRKFSTNSHEYYISKIISDNTYYKLRTEKKKGESKYFLLGEEEKR